MQMKILLISIIIFCILHIIRDYLQIKGVKNAFTQVGHFWDAPEYEMHGIVVLSVIALICTYFLIKKFY